MAVRAPTAYRDTVWDAVRGLQTVRATATPRFAAYEDDPLGFIERELGDFLWSKQREIVEAIRTHRHVAVHSCHDSGKTWLVARIMAWWCSTFDAGDARALSTAPTFAQVRTLLWYEIKKAHSRAKLPGRVSQTSWHRVEGSRANYTAPQPTELEVAFGRKPADGEDAAVGLQGVHAKRVLVAIDEAGGVPKAIFDAAETLATNELSRIIAIGNPDDPTSYFAEICKPGSGWHVVHIDGLDTPNFTDEPVPEWLRPLLLSPTWVEERRTDWGEDSPLYVAKVRGRFPQEALDGVVPLSWVRRCQQEPDVAEAALVPVELGVDVGAGGDETVIRERRGMRVGRVWRGHWRESEDAANAVLHAIRETGASAIKVDVVGVGWGIAGRLRAMAAEGKHAAKVVDVNVAEKSTEPEKYERLRDEIWWEVGRKLSQDQAWDLTPLAEKGGDLYEGDDRTIAQLTAPKYALTAGGRIRIEPKEDTRKRIGRSPDDADALLLAFYTPATGGWAEYARRELDKLQEAG